VGRADASDLKNHRNYGRYKKQIKKVCAVFGILYQLEFQPEIAVIASY